MNSFGYELSVKTAAEGLVSACGPCVGVIAEEYRLLSFDWFVLEMLASMIGPEQIVEHLRVLADLAEKYQLDKIVGYPPAMPPAGAN